MHQIEASIRKSYVSEFSKSRNDRNSRADKSNLDKQSLFSGIVDDALITKEKVVIPEDDDVNIYATPNFGKRNTRNKY